MIKKNLPIQIWLFIASIFCYLHLDAAIGRAKPAGSGQSSTLEWESIAKGSANIFFEKTLKDGNIELAKELLNYFTADKTALSSGNSPIKELLEVITGNYPGGRQSGTRILEGAFYARVQTANPDKQLIIDQIIEMIIDKTEPPFFTNPTNGLNTLNELIVGQAYQPIPYLHFALGHGMTSVAKKLIEKNSAQSSKQTTEGLSVFAYAFKGGIQDSDLIQKLTTKGALVTEKDFDYFADLPTKVDFLMWLNRYGVPTKNASAKAKPLEAEAKKITAERVAFRFAQSLSALAKAE